MSSIKCGICSCPGAHKCSSCHSIAYCGPERQETDWPLHKVLCKKLALFLASQPRPEGAKLVIILPEEDKTPELRWVVYGERLGENKGYDLKALNTLLGGRSLYKPINRNHWRNINVDDHTVVTQWNTFNYGSRPFNKCILALTAGPAQSKVCGPIAILSHTGKSNSPNAVYQDITLSDFSTAISHLKYIGLYQQTDISAPLFDLRIFKPRIGAQVSCMSTNAKAQVQTLAVQHDHPIFKSKPKSISVAMGLSLLMHWSPKPKVVAPTDTITENPFFDIAAVASRFNADTESAQWGILSGLLDPVSSGSILIVRQDGKEFCVKTCMAFLDFVSWYMNQVAEYREDTDEVSETYKARADFQKQCLARDRFEASFEEFKSKAVRKDLSWNDVVSPFDV